MNPETTKGIWCRMDKKFYYYDPGIHASNKGFRTIISTLTQRNLLPAITKPGAGNEPWLFMTLAEANQAGYEVVVFKLSKNQPETKITNAWGE